jgi:hypothetical protein
MLGMAWVNKKQKTVVALTVSLFFMVVTIPAAIWVTHTQGAELGNERARCNKGIHATHKVVIQDGQVIPAHTVADKCDTLTIVNLDSQDRLMAFGRHESHISYDGISEKDLSHGQNLTVTLIRSGDYLFHDHLDDSVRGDFTVKQ